MNCPYAGSSKPAQTFGKSARNSRTPNARFPLLPPQRIRRVPKRRSNGRNWWIASPARSNLQSAPEPRAEVVHRFKLGRRSEDPPHDVLCPPPADSPHLGCDVRWRLSSRENLQDYKQVVRCLLPGREHTANGGLQSEHPTPVHVAVRNRLLSRLYPAPGPLGAGTGGTANVARFAEAEGLAIVGEFTEVGTGRHRTRSTEGHSFLPRLLLHAISSARWWRRGSTGCPATSPSSPS